MVSWMNKTGQETLKNVLRIDKLVRLQIIGKQSLPRTFPFFIGYSYQVRLDVAPNDLTDKADDERFVCPDFRY